jgi:hypothetical protein
MIKKPLAKNLAICQPFRLAFHSFLSHDNQPQGYLCQSGPQKLDRMIESFDSGGNTYV